MRALSRKSVAKREAPEPVVAHAIAVFGDESKASHWLASPLPIFGERSPSQLLATPDGAKRVEQILTRIEHNIPS